MLGEDVVVPRRLVAMVVAVAASALVGGCASDPPGPRTLPLQRVSVTDLTGGPVRFDYTALDAARGRLFIARAVLKMETIPAQVLDIARTMQSTHVSKRIRDAAARVATVQTG
jgi:hypothetical protein